MTSLPDESDFTLGEQMAITLAPVVSGTLSILGSSWIIWMLFRKDSNTTTSTKLLYQKNGVKYRFLLALSICDIINSWWFVFFALPIPQDTPGVWGARGNAATCNAQGFFLQMGILGSFYNGGLALYYHKSLVDNMTDAQIAQQYELKLHVGAILWTVGTATAALLQNLYSYSGIGCWIAPEPLRCHRDDDVECVRGERAYIYAWLYTGIPLCLMLLYIAYSMRLIYKKVEQVSKRAMQWNLKSASLKLGSHESNFSLDINNNNNNNVPAAAASSQGAMSPVVPTDREKVQSCDTQETTKTETSKAVVSSTKRKPPPSSSSSNNATTNTNNNDKYARQIRDTAKQAALYVAAYLVTHGVSFCITTTEMFGGTCPAWLLILQNLTWPLQGFANVLVFLRPKINTLQRENPEFSYLTALRWTLRQQIR